MANFIPASVANKLKNPGERSKISNADLKKYAPALYAKRVRNNENATLYNPNALLSGESLRTAVKGAVDAELNPQVAAKTREATDLASQRDQVAQIVSGIYGQLAGITGTAVDKAVTGSSNLATGLAKSGSDFLGSIDAAGKASAAVSAQDQAIRGTGLDAGTSQRLAQEFIDQKTRAQAQQFGAQSLATAQSQGFIGNTGTAAAVLPAQASAAVTGLADKFNTDIRGATKDAADLEATRGGLTAKVLADMRTSEFEKSATAQTLKLKGFEANTSRAGVTGIDPTTGKPTAAAKAATARAQADKARSDETKRHNKAMEAAKNDPTAASIETARHNRVMEDIAKGKLKTKKESGLTPTGTPILPAVAHSKAMSQLEEARQHVRDQIKTLGRDRHKIKLAQDKDGTSLWAGLNPALLSAALDAEIDGHLSPVTIKKLWRAGIRVKSTGISTDRKKPTYKSIPGLGSAP